MTWIRACLVASFALVVASAAPAEAQGQCYVCYYEIDPTFFSCRPNPSYGALSCASFNSPTGGSCSTGAYDCGSPDIASAIRSDGSKVAFEFRLLASTAARNRLDNCSGQLLFAVADVRVHRNLSVVRL